MGTRVHREIGQISLVLIFFGTILLANGCGTGSTSTQAPAAAQNFSIVYSASPVAQSLQPPSSPLITNAYFGMHINNLANPALNSAQQTPFPAFSFSTMRLWDNVGWNSIETGRGTYDWTRMDGTIQKATANGVSDFVFTFGYVPPWASSNPSDPCGGTYQGTCDAPSNLADLDSFANLLVQRYCGVVKYYETWNEPSDPGFWAGTNQQLLAITQSIYAAVKSPANCGCTGNTCSPGGGTNPNKVLMPPINSPTSDTAKQWLQSWLSYAGNPYPYADVATFHGYGYTANPEGLQNGVLYMRSTLAQYGMGSAELWNTEASWGDSAGLTEDEQASWVIRYQIVQAISGVSRFMWYAYDNCKWGTLWDSGSCKISNSAPGSREAATAYATAQQWLTGATVQSCEEHADGTWLCKLTRSGNYVAWAVWNSNGTAITLNASDMPGMAQYRDWQNQKTTVASSVEIGAMPILLENEDGF